MARIRTLKPEFPQSESMGNVSRDARLAFIELWTIADDEGRLRGNSRMLASLLFPYDDDAPALIDTWLGELEREGCIVRYKVDGQTYLEICNWLIHQKIDKPSRSKIPSPSEGARIVAKPRECSSEDQGPRIKDQGVDLVLAVASGSATSKSETALQAACRITWAAYVEAYVKRYGTDPIRDAKANSCIKAFVQSIGMEEAPHVARFYVEHNKAFYVQRCHEPSLLKSDAAGLRTEWATGRRITATGAREADRLQETGDMWSRLIEEHETMEAGNGHP